MYRCADCGFTFHEPDYERFYEDHGNGIVEPWVVKRCPDCGSEEINEYDPDYLVEAIREMRL